LQRHLCEPCFLSNKQLQKNLICTNTSFQIKMLHSVRTCPEFSVHLGFAYPFSHNQRPFLVNTRLGPDMLHPMLPVGAQKIKTKTVCFLVNFVNELLPQGCSLGGINNTFKNRKLYPLTIILACFRHPSKPSLPAFVHCRNVIAYQYKHSELSPAKNRVPVQVAANKTSQQLSLGMKIFTQMYFRLSGFMPCGKICKIWYMRNVLPDVVGRE